MNTELKSKSSDRPVASSQKSSDSIHVTKLPRWVVPAMALGAGAIAAFLAFGVFDQSTKLSESFAPAMTILLVGSLIYNIAIYIASSVVEGSRYAIDRIVTGIVSTMFGLAVVPLISVTLTVVVKGMRRFDAALFLESMRSVTGEGGGAHHAIMGTLMITGWATLISVPIGVMTAIYLVEYGNKGPMSRALTFFVDVMTGIPSIVAGLFAAALFVVLTGDPGYRAGIVGAVALSVLMIPTVVKSTEEMLRIVPRELREASYALGVSKWLTITKVVLPTAIAGIATGVTLAIARVMGETAPLLVTVGYSASDNFNVFDGEIGTLPVMSFNSYASPGVFEEAGLDRAWATALLLVVMVMILNIAARLISKFFAPKGSR